MVRIGAIVLTQGSRPQMLQAAVASLTGQRGVDLDVVVVGNGWQPTGLPAGVRALALPENIGIPGGRNAGVPAVAGDLLAFLDDDARWSVPDALARLAALFDADPKLGAVQPRVVDPDDGTTAGRWVPRLRVGDPAHSSDVCALWEGAVVVRREVFEAAGGWPAEFFYAHEGIEFAWRVWDAGYRVRYVGDVQVAHPGTAAWRHAAGLRQQARNRVWLARRSLPVPLAAGYLATWGLLDLVRTRRPGELAAGWRDGWTGDPGPRRPLRWRTVLAMTRAGRPPVV